MADRHDDLGDWLSEPVHPLLPPPGAFERIRTRARRRKARRAVVSAMAAGAALTAAVLAPQFLSPLGPQYAAAPSPHPISSPSTLAPTAVKSPARGSGTADGTISSVTFVSHYDGWALGQSRSASGCARPAGTACAFLARTANFGRSWRTVPAPPAAPAGGGLGVSQTRFLNTNDGWVFGPQLWVTHDGGRSWRRISTKGLRVTSLETAQGHAFAIWARCSGSRWAAACTTFSLYTAPATSDRWTAVPQAANLSAGGQPASAQLVLTSTRAYLLAPGGELLSGPTTGGAGWHVVAGGPTGRSLPCAPGAAQPDGQPAWAMLASNGPGLLLLCAGAPAPDGSQAKTLFQSADNGQTWRQVSSPPTEGRAQSLSGSPTGSVVVLATSVGLAVSTDGGATWQPAQPARGAFPPGGFAYVGMTYDNLGVAVAGEPGHRAIWVTRDGALTWQSHPVP